MVTESNQRMQSGFSAVSAVSSRRGQGSSDFDKLLAEVLPLEHADECPRRLLKPGDEMTEQTEITEGTEKFSQASSFPFAAVHSVCCSLLFFIHAGHCILLK